jgi:DNA-binding NarL/FixJ family response regulator
VAATGIGPGAGVSTDRPGTGDARVGDADGPDAHGSGDAADVGGSDVSGVRVGDAAEAGGPGADRVIRVVVVDDQELVRTGFRVILDVEDDIEVVGEASDGSAAIDVVSRHRPDVVLMDIQMPLLDGIEATRRLVRDAVDTAVVILTTFLREDYVVDAVRAGASGFLLKNAPAEELLHAVRVAARGDALLSPAVTRQVLARLADDAPDLRAAERLGELTEREVEVLAQVAAGLSNAEIAERLLVGEATVKTHVSRVLTKLGLRDRVQAVVFAYESGLARPGGRPGRSSSPRLPGEPRQ